MPADYNIRAGKITVRISSFYDERHRHVAGFVVAGQVFRRICILQGGDDGQLLIFHVDIGKGLFRRFFIHRNDCGDYIADKPDIILRK